MLKQYFEYIGLNYILLKVNACFFVFLMQFKITHITQFKITHLWSTLYFYWTVLTYNIDI